jgi:penicillin amidase
VVSDPAQLKLVEQLAQWKGDYPLESTSATLFNQFLFNLADATMHDELGNDFFETLLSTRVIDAALPRLAASPDSPWWDNRNTLGKETRADTVKAAWQASIAHLKTTLGGLRAMAVGQGPYADPWPSVGAAKTIGPDFQCRPVRGPRQP